MPTRRALLTVALSAGVLGAGALSGCSSNPPDQAPGLGDRAVRRPASWAERRGVRAALKASLPDSSWNATLSDSRTTVRVVRTPLHDWWVADLLHRGENHPRRIQLAVGPRRAARVLSGAEPTLSEVLIADGYRAEDAGQATVLARLTVDLTRDFDGLLYEVDSIDEIPTRQGGSGRLERYRDTIAAPAALATGGGWQVRLFQMHDTTLEERTLLLPGTGGVSSSTRVVATDLPAPIGR